jgi:uncharacterized cupin superfamily protein
MKRTSLLQCDTQTLDQGNFAFKRKRLGADVGSKGLGTSWFELPAGKKAFPFHFHLANEEALFVLEGEGVLRSGPDGKDEHLLRPGDYVSFPPGPPGHQVINRSSAPLRFLAFSTLLEPEVAVYPDSKKIGFLARGRGIYSVHKEESAVDYYEGEE